MRQKYLLLFSLIIFFYGNSPAQYYRSNNNILYMGIGTGISSFVGGDFGNRFAIRMTVPNYHYNNYYNNYNNSYHYDDYDNYHDDYYSFYPLQMDFTLGIKTSELIAIEVTTGYIWHNHGDVYPAYTTGTYGSYDYTDRYDWSELYAIPIIASLKIYPAWHSRVPLYLKAGYGAQYTHEELSRVREYFDPSVYYGNYGGVYSTPIAHYHEARWLHGFSVALGYSLGAYEHPLGDVEFKYSNFFSEERPGSALAMNRTSNIGNISFGMKYYFGF